MFPYADIWLKCASYSILSHSTFFALLWLCITQSISALPITYFCGLLLKFVWCRGFSLRVWNSPFSLVTAFLLQLIFWHIYQRYLFVNHLDQLSRWSCPSTVGCGKVERTTSSIKATFKRLGFCLGHSQFFAQYLHSTIVLQFCQIANNTVISKQCFELPLHLSIFLSSPLSK